MMAFHHHYDNLKTVLLPHVEEVASLACLIPADIDQSVMFSSTMSADVKVNKLLDAVQRYISGNSKCLLRFVEVLKKEGSFLGLMGVRLENTYYCEPIPVSSGHVTACWGVYSYKDLSGML